MVLEWDLVDLNGWFNHYMDGYGELGRGWSSTWWVFITTLFAPV